MKDFKADDINQKWCTDFTYLALANGDKRYNCSIIDLYDRSIVASITGKHITATLAKETLQKAIDSKPGIIQDGLCYTQIKGAGILLRSSQNTVLSLESHKV